MAMPLLRRELSEAFQVTRVEVEVYSFGSLARFSRFVGRPGDIYYTHTMSCTPQSHLMIYISRGLLGPLWGCKMAEWNLHQLFGGELVGTPERVKALATENAESVIRQNKRTRRGDGVPES